MIGFIISICIAGFSIYFIDTYYNQKERKLREAKSKMYAALFPPIPKNYHYRLTPPKTTTMKAEEAKKISDLRNYEIKNSLGKVHSQIKNATEHGLYYTVAWYLTNEQVTKLQDDGYIVAEGAATNSHIIKWGSVEVALPITPERPADLTPGNLKPARTTSESGVGPRVGRRYGDDFHDTL